MKAHLQNKDSEILWVENIPTHWDMWKVKFVSFYQNGAAFKSDLFRNDGDVFVIRIGDLVGSKVSLDDATTITKENAEGFENVRLKKNDILLALTGATIGKSALFELEEECYLNQRVALFRPRKNISKEYLMLFIDSVMFRTHIDFECYGGAQENVGKPQILNAKLPLPPLPEQRQIAAYLDYKTNQIDRFITNRKKQIELLEERKAKTIEKAILRGIDRGVALKDSGFDWIGQIPNHWEIWKLKFLARITTGNKDTVDREDDGEYPFYVRSDNVERISTYSFDGEAILTAGDGVGVAKVFHYANGKFDFHQRVYCIYNFRKVLGKYAYYFIKTNFIKEVKKQSALTTVDSLRLPMLSNLQITLPPIKEQKIIIEYIECELNDYEELISKYQKQIDLMQEYKTSLISKAVTGKIDVREWQPKQTIKETV